VVVSLADQLVVVRDRLLSELQVAEGAAVASIAKELRATLTQLDGLLVDREASAVDDLARKRAARRADATHPGGAAVGDDSGRPGGRRTR
jgi:hypothetical protein